jgi:hypothetical protein
MMMTASTTTTTATATAARPPAEWLCRSVTLAFVLHVFLAPLGKFQDSNRLWGTTAASFHILTGCFFSIKPVDVISLVSDLCVGVSSDEYMFI